MLFDYSTHLRKDLPKHFSVPFRQNLLANECKQNRRHVPSGDVLHSAGDRNLFQLREKHRNVIDAVAQFLVHDIKDSKDNRRDNCC